MTTKISHHPDAATLMSYAAGSLPEPLTAVIAAHASGCPVCQREVRILARMGGALLEQHGEGRDGRWSRSLPPRPSDSVEQPLQGAEMADAVPAPIRAQYGVELASVPWKRLGPGVWHHRLPLSPGVKGDLRLLKIAAGRPVPEHGHGGTELTLVLDGAFSDATGRYGQGDIQDVDADVEHQPVADRDVGCICIVASEHPARFKGFFSRLLQPLTGM